ncbi:MAG: hypothetical protein U0163_16600 [Gemmatimonadaceae bacterium]
MSRSAQLPPVGALSAESLRVLSAQLERRLNCVDIVVDGALLRTPASSLAGVRHEVTYGRRAAVVEFEASASQGP